MNEDPRAFHPIGVAATRTGLSQSVLRAWERRYGAVRPRRSAGGQRLYSDPDVERLRLLRSAVEGGRAIGRIATLPTDELRALVRDDRRAQEDGSRGPLPAASEEGPSRDPGPGGEAVFLRAGLASVEALDQGGLERVLRRAAIGLDPARLVEGVVAPLLRKIGESWERGTLSPAGERLASGVVGAFLRGLLETLREEGDVPVMLVATPSGEQHELGALLAGAAGAAAGWHVVALGPNLPPDDIAHAARRTGVSLVGLSVIRPAGEPEDVERQVARLRSLLPPEVTLVVGGAGALSRRAALEETGAEVTAELSVFRDRLRPGILLDVEPGGSSPGRPPPATTDPHRTSR
jgi:MerR family transcriptional regulator, light-induced transcriptional regulator